MIPRMVYRVGWAVHRAVFTITGGRVGTERAQDGRLGTLFITTTSRRSGRRRRNPLFYLEDGSNLVVAASNIGAAHDPGWWRNLQADSRATVDLAGEQFPVNARRAASDEADRLWPRFIAANSAFATYRTNADREIALVVLEVIEPG